MHTTDVQCYGLNKATISRADEQLTYLVHLPTDRCPPLPTNLYYRSVTLWRLHLDRFQESECHTILPYVAFYCFAKKVEYITVVA